MATCELAHRPHVSPAVQSALEGLRWRIRRYVWLEGLGGVAAWLGLAFWATLLVDWFFEPGPFVRGLTLGAILAVLAVIAWRLIGRRALVRITDGNVATVLERHFPQLDDSLLTAVVLSGRNDDEIDDRMLAETCRQAAARLAAVDVHRVFDPRPLRAKCGAGGLLALSVVAFALFASDAFGVWARRTLTLSDQLWPRSTRLDVEGFPGGVRKVARGSDVEIIAKADTRMPRRAAGGRTPLSRRRRRQRPGDDGTPRHCTSAGRSVPGICVYVPKRAGRHPLRSGRRR